MDGETLLVLVCVALAAAYLVRQLWLTLVGTGKGCGGSCGCDRQPAQDEPQPLIPRESLHVRRRV